jgi:hypothetical protein
MSRSQLHRDHSAALVRLRTKNCFTTLARERPRQLAGMSIHPASTRKPQRLFRAVRYRQVRPFLTGTVDFVCGQTIVETEFVSQFLTRASSKCSKSRQVANDSDCRL